MIGKDTRLSGLHDRAGPDRGLPVGRHGRAAVGPLPTPAVGILTRSMRADLGVMISASHNPYEDNGIKLFGPDGFKLSDEVEVDDRSAARRAGERPRRAGGARPRHAPRRRGRPLHRGGEGELPARASSRRPQDRGRLRQWRSLQGRADRAVGTGRGGDPDRRVARRLQHQRGCGSTHPDTMCRKVVKHDADIGIALDGDADRVIVADEQGS